MTVWPDSPADESDGNDWTAAKVNAIYEMLEALVEIPYFTLIETTNQTVSTNTLTDITFNSMTLDSGTGVNWTIDDANNDIEADANADGLYLFGAQVSFAADADGYRRVQIEQSGANVATQILPATPTGTTVLQCQTIVLPVVATDKLQLEVRHTAGGDLDITHWRFWGLWVGKISSAA
jgi:hypothetical protein